MRRVSDCLPTRDTRGKNIREVSHRFHPRLRLACVAGVTNFTYIFAPCISCGQTVRYTAQLGLLGFASSQYVVKKKNRRLGFRGPRRTLTLSPVICGCLVLTLRSLVICGCLVLTLRSPVICGCLVLTTMFRHLWLPRANYDVPSSVVASC